MFVVVVSTVVAVSPDRNIRVRNLRVYASALVPKDALHGSGPFTDATPPYVGMKMCRRIHEPTGRATGVLRGAETERPLYDLFRSSYVPPSPSPHHQANCPVFV